MYNYYTSLLPFGKFVLFVTVSIGQVAPSWINFREGHAIGQKPHYSTIEALRIECVEHIHILTYACHSWSSLSLLWMLHIIHAQLCHCIFMHYCVFYTAGSVRPCPFPVWFQLVIHKKVWFFPQLGFSILTTLFTLGYNCSVSMDSQSEPTTSGQCKPRTSTLAMHCPRKVRSASTYRL